MFFTFYQPGPDFRTGDKAAVCLIVEATSLGKASVVVTNVRLHHDLMIDYDMENYDVSDEPMMYGEHVDEHSSYEDVQNSFIVYYADGSTIWNVPNA